MSAIIMRSEGDLLNAHIAGILEPGSHLFNRYRLEQVIISCNISVMDKIERC